MVDTHQTPGARTPGPNDPGARQPGPQIPDPSVETVQEVSATGVAVDATGTTLVGDAAGFNADYLRVMVDATAADFSFNIVVGGTSLFDSAQSPSGTSPEVFAIPANFVGGPAPEAYIEVTSASGTGGATADVDLYVGVADR